MHNLSLLEVEPLDLASGGGEDITSWPLSMKVLDLSRVDRVTLGRKLSLKGLIIPHLRWEADDDLYLEVLSDTRWR